jgi:hypothetical protein
MTMKDDGYLTITIENASQYEDLTEVTGRLDVREGATLTAPALTKTGRLYVPDATC